MEGNFASILYGSAPTDAQPASPSASVNPHAAILYGDGAGSEVVAPSTAPEPPPIQDEIIRRRRATEIELGLDPVEQEGTDDPGAVDWSKGEIKVPNDILAARDLDTARKMYGASQFAELLPNNLLAGLAGLDGMPDELRVAVVKEFREMSVDLGMGKQDLEVFKRSFSSVVEPASLEQKATWHDEAVHQLNQTYRHDAKGALRDAIKFVNQDPRRAAMLDRSGAGDKPEMILLMAKLARQARAAGKLK